MIRFLPDGIQCRVTGEENAAIRNCRRPYYRFRLRLSSQLVLVENLATRCGWFEYEELSVLSTDVKLSVGEHWRRFLNRAEVLQPELLAGIYVKRGDVGAVIDLVHSIAIDHR